MLQLEIPYHSTYIVKNDGRFYLKNGAVLLYGDLPEPEASGWGSRLIAQSYDVQETEITNTAYKYVPSTYLICENDKAALPQYQQMFAEQSGSEVLRCEAGHSPMLSHHEMLVKSIIDAVKVAVAELK